MHTYIMYVCIKVCERVLVILVHRHQLSLLVHRLMNASRVLLFTQHHTIIESLHLPCEHNLAASDSSPYSKVVAENTSQRSSFLHAQTNLKVRDMRIIHFHLPYLPKNMLSMERTQVFANILLNAKVQRSIGCQL